MSDRCHFGDDCQHHPIAGCPCGRGVCSIHASADSDSSWQRHIREHQAAREKAKDA